MLVLPYAPLLIYLKLFDDFFDKCNLIYFNLEIPIFLDFIIGFTLIISYLTRLFVVIFVLLKDIEDKLLPEVELVGAIDDAWGSIYFYCDLPRDEVEEVDISLIDHLGRVQEHVLLIAERLYQKLQEALDACFAALEEFRSNHQRNYLIDKAVGDIVPSVLTDASLSKGKVTVRYYKIRALSTLSFSYGQVSPNSLETVSKFLMRLRS